MPNRNERRIVDNYYYSTSSADVLGWPNPDAAMGNPFKGLMRAPWYGNYNADNSSFPSSLEWFYMGLDTLMKGDPDVVGEDAAFDWTEMESRLNETASRNNHAVFTVVLHYPGWDGLNVPQYLLDAGMKLVPIPAFLGDEYSPDYGDPILLNALEQYIKALGARYDGDHRIGFIHLGLLGFWGEWHTYPNDFVPETTQHSVVDWYRAAFNTTKLQVRYPFEPAYEAGFGLSDGSFAFETLGGDANGGIDHFYYFSNVVKSAGMDDFWRTGPMGGETRPEIQDIVFKPDYPAGTYQRQDFMLCVNTTHASYILHNNAFERNYEGEELANALHAHTHMGYNFVVSNVAVAVSDMPDEVDIAVTVTQIGVAPFYYALELVLDCPDPDLAWPRTNEGVETIIAEGDAKLFWFVGIPATLECLNNVSLSLDSPHTYKERPIKFAQGIEGRVLLSIPLPTALSSPLPPALSTQKLTTKSSQGGSNSQIVASSATVAVIACLFISTMILVAWRRHRCELRTRLCNSNIDTIKEPSNNGDTSSDDDISARLPSPF